MLKLLAVAGAALLTGVVAAPPSLAEDGVATAFYDTYDTGQFTYHIVGNATMTAPGLDGITHVQGNCAASHDPGTYGDPGWGWSGMTMIDCYVRNDATGERFLIDGVFTYGPEAAVYVGGFAYVVESEEMSYCVTLTGPGVPSGGHTVCAPFLP